MITRLARYQLVQARNFMIAAMLWGQGRRIVGDMRQRLPSRPSLVSWCQTMGAEKFSLVCIQSSIDRGVILRLENKLEFLHHAAESNVPPCLVRMQTRLHRRRLARKVNDSANNGFAFAKSCAKHGRLIRLERWSNSWIVRHHPAFACSSQRSLPTRRRRRVSTMDDSSERI